MRSFAKVVAALVSSVAVVTAVHAETFTLAAETWAQGAFFKQGTVLSTFNQSSPTVPERGTLSRPYTAGEITWAQDRAITFDSRMVVQEGTVQQGKFAERTLAPNSLLNFYPNGMPISITLAAPLTLNAYIVDVPGSSGLTLYADGSIRSAAPNTPFIFVSKGSGRRYFLAAGTTQFWPVDLSVANRVLAAGALKQATLSVAHAYQLDVLPANTVVGFDGAGEITSIRCPITCTYKRFVLNGGGAVELAPSGQFTLIGNQHLTIGGRTYPAGQQLLLTFEGTVIAAAAPQ